MEVRPDPVLRSMWLDTAPAAVFGELDGDVEVDVAVIGGGIVGVTAALLLQRAGASVALVEARRVGTGVTGYSTAKVTSLHGLTYARLLGRFGEETARAYGEANEAGLERIASFVRELGIDCDFRRKPNYTYTEAQGERDRIEEEVATAARLGLPASYTEELDLPFPIAAAVRFEDQAEFDPVRYVARVAEEVSAGGGHVFERTRALDVDDGAPCVVRAERGSVRASRVIVATHMPFLDRGLFFARVHPERSYVLAVSVRGGLPSGMYLSTEQPAHSLRTARSPSGDDLLLVGGESHKTAHARSSERYLRLEQYAREHFEVERIAYRWATQDNMPVDGMPYVGRLWPFSDRLLTATGLRKWGLANGTAAAMMLSDRVLDRPNPWARHFDSMRLRPLAAAPDFAKENADVAVRFFADRLRGLRASPPRSGEGRVVRSGLEQVALSRDDAGKLHSVSARCTHLGCIVLWNDAERTWDCPCHGSRFAADGAVVQGPAVRPLEPKRPPG